MVARWGIAHAARFSASKGIAANINTMTGWLRGLRVGRAGPTPVASNQPVMVPEPAVGSEPEAALPPLPAPEPTGTGTAPLLTAEQLLVAIRATATYRASSGGFAELLHAIGLPVMAPPEDVATMVALWQAEHPPVVVDGALGPKTAAAIRGSTWRPPIGHEHIIVGGRSIEARGLRVVRWRESGGLSFVGEPGWAARAQAADGPNLIVLHHDGARSSQGCYQTLLARSLAVQFMVDTDGTVYQALDALAVASHAGVVNGRSVGIEVNNPVELRFDDAKHPRPRVKIGTPQYGARGPDPDAIVLGFHPAQVQATLLLVDLLCATFKIPRQLPGANGKVAVVKDTRVAAGTFAGVCGHLAVTSRKFDPGAALLGYFVEDGYVVA